MRDELMINATCNRTELYGFANQHKFSTTPCGIEQRRLELFDTIGYQLQKSEAIDHLFKVGTGLDSQILGDFEVISQLKKSFLLSKKQGMVNGHSERLVNAVIQASKRVKTETKLSTEPPRSLLPPFVTFYHITNSESSQNITIRNW